MTTAAATSTSLVKRLAALLNGPTLLLTVGLGLSAAAGSGFLATVNHSPLLSPAIAPLQGLYLLLQSIGTGMFAGFEQEMTRAVSRALALGQPERVVIRQQARNAAVVALGTMLVLCVGAPFVVHKWLSGEYVVFAELMLGLAGTWAAFLVRGVLSGRRQFRSYAITMVVEGLARLLPAIVLVATGLYATWSFGLVYALGFVVAALSGLVVAREPLTDAPPPPDAAEQEMETANQAAVRLARLTGGILAGQVLMYAVPLYVDAKLDQHTQASLVVAVVAAIGLTRLALLILFPLQAPLLPKLTAAAARREMGAVRRTAAGLVAVCVAAGVFGVLVSGTLGPWILHVIMGTRQALPRTFLIELAVGTLFLLVANVLQSALIALNRQQTVLYGWILGVLVMGGMFLLPFDVLTTAAVAAMAGPLVTALMMALDVLRSTRPQPAGPAPAPARDERVLR
jgi:O-antigen/teichoic acid export membrane protein